MSRVHRRGVVPTMQILNFLGDKFSYLDSQNETLISNCEKNLGTTTNHALFWAKFVSIRYLENSLNSIFKFLLKMSWMILTYSFYRLHRARITMGNKSTVFQKAVHVKLPLLIVTLFKKLQYSFLIWVFW